jgi:hydrogenase maturation protease
LTSMANGKVLVLGIGNLLWADEGFGVRVVEALQRNYEFSPEVSLMDGGTQGLALIPYVQQADTLVIADAVDFHEAPGTLVEVHDAEVPAYLSYGKMSLHQVSFQEVLALSQLMGASPARLCLIGVQPEQLDDYGGSLSATVKAQIEPAVSRIVAYLGSLGIETRARTSDGQASSALDMERYEAQRPSAEEACRVGDARFLPDSSVNP